MRVAATLVALVAAASCGRSKSKPKESAPTAQPNAQLKPVTRPTQAPTFLTMAEVTPRHVTVPEARIVTPLGLDVSGKQVIVTACLVSADAVATMNAIATQYEAAGWTQLKRDTGTNTRSSFAGDVPVVDGMLHVQGQIRRAPGCPATDLAVEIAYTKMVPLAPPAPPPAATDRTAPAPVR